MLGDIPKTVIQNGNELQDIMGEPKLWQPSKKLPLKNDDMYIKSTLHCTVNQIPLEIAAAIPKMQEL